MAQENDKIIRFLVKGNSGNIIFTTPLDNIIDDVLDAKTLADHLKADKPLTLTPSASGTVLTLTIDDKVLCYVAEYGKTTYADLVAHKDKPIAIKDGNLIAPASTWFEEYYAKMDIFSDGAFYVYQLNIDNEWSRTQLDTSSVLVCDVHSTTYQEAFDASYCYVKDDEGIIFGLTEKTNQYVRFTNIDNDMRHIWTVNTDNQWFLTDEALCENKMDVNPSALYVSTPDEAKLEVHDKQVYISTPGQIFGHANNVSIYADNQWSLNAKTLYTNVNNLTGNLPTLVLKNLTTSYPEGNPRALFANKDGTQLSYVDNMDIGTMSAFFNNWTQADGPIKSKIETTTIEIED